MPRHSFAVGDHHAEVYVEPGPEWQRCEEALLAAGLPLPLTHRCAWATRKPSQGAWFVAIRDHSGAYQAGIGVQVSPSRALPGHLLLRAERFGDALTSSARDAALRALARVAVLDRRILRLHVEVFTTDDVVRTEIARAAAELGLHTAEPGRCYSHTVLVDLAPDEDKIFACLHSTARRHIRAVSKKPVELRVIDDVGLTHRLDSLLQETLARTGGDPNPHDWPTIIRFSTQHPSLSRLVGLFRTDGSGEESLLAFAWGRAQGRFVEYATAASTRETDLKMPLVYPLAWDLIVWAKRVGAGHFDFGGISPGSHADEEDRLGGISDFKRYFTTDRVRVGEEWILEPHPLKAALAHAVTSGYTLLAGLRR